MAKDEATPSQPTTKGEEEEKVVEVFEVFNRPESLEAPTSDFNHFPSAQVSQIQEDFSVPKAIGIQCKPRASLFNVMESQSRNKAPEKTSSAKLPLPPSSLPPWLDPADHKRKKD